MLSAEASDRADVVLDVEPRMTRMRLGPIDEMTFDALTKGMPATAEPLRLADIPGQGWNLLAGDLPFPVAILRRSRLEANNAWMGAFVEHCGVALCPHGKTSMSPQLLDRQLMAGAWGVTCATAQQAEVYFRFGAKRVVLANQLMGEANLALALGRLRNAEVQLFVLVDSAEGVELLEDQWRRLRLTRQIDVLLEVGATGGRTGVRSLDEGEALAELVAASPALRLAGVETYESLYHGEPAATAEAKVAEVLDTAAELVRRLVLSARFETDGQPVILSAGGSDYFDMVADRFGGLDLGVAIQVVLRSGCYITSDEFYYAGAARRIASRTPELRAFERGIGPALEVWAVVQSRPEPTRAYATLGKRDAGHDWEPPSAKFWYRKGLHQRPEPIEPGSCQTLKLNDQHAHLKIAADAPFRPGDLIGFGVSHPCTTFDKWRLIHEVDDRYQVTGAFVTFF
jgi:D-serine dehydratase